MEKRRKFRLTHKGREYLLGYGFISIWLIGFAVFTLQPLCYSVYLSMHNVKITALGLENTYIGIKNYQDAFLMDISFTDYLLGFLRELVLTAPAVLVFALIIALILNLKIRFRSIFRLFFFLPVIIMAGPVIEQLRSQGAFTLPGLDDYGFIWFIENNFSEIPGISSILISLISNIVPVLWYTGVQSLIFLSALQKVDRQIYEASRIDGASPWESFWKITLPSLKSMILVNLIYTIVTLSAFELNEVSRHISNNIFDIKTGFGYASAMAWIYFVVLAVILAVIGFVMTYEPKSKRGR